MRLICSRCNRYKRMTPLEYRVCGKCKQTIKSMEKKRSGINERRKA